MFTREGKGVYRNRKEVRNLILNRMESMRRHESQAKNVPLKSFYSCQESILEEVLRRAHGHLDSESLVELVDVCIRECRLYQRLTSDRGLKSFYGFRVRILRGILLYISRKLSPKRWIRKRRERRRPR